MGSVFQTWPTVSTSIFTFGTVAGSACHQSGHCLALGSSTVSLLVARCCGGDIWCSARKFEPPRNLKEDGAVTVSTLGRPKISSCVARASNNCRGCAVAYNSASFQRQGGNARGWVKYIYPMRINHKSRVAVQPPQFANASQHVSCANTTGQMSSRSKLSEVTRCDLSSQDFLGCFCGRGVA